MALKLKITKAQYDKLSDDVKSEYVENDDGKGYTLDVDGIEDTSSLTRARDREKQAAKELRTKLAEAEARLAEIDGDDARKSGDIDKITKAATAKYDKDTGELKDQVTKLRDKLSGGALDRVANDIANRISKAPKLMLPHIKSKLAVELDDDGEVSIKVLGDDGKPSTTSLENFEKGLVNDKDFADIIIASKASGGGGAGRKDPPANGGAGHHPNNSGDPPPDLSKMAPADMVARLKAKKEAAA